MNSKPEKDKTRLRLPFAAFRLIFRLEKTVGLLAMETMSGKLGKRIRLPKAIHKVGIVPAIFESFPVERVASDA